MLPTTAVRDTWWLRLTLPSGAADSWAEAPDREDRELPTPPLTPLREWGVDWVFGYPGDGLNGISELIGAGVAKALLVADVLSDELPYVTGSVGLLGTRPSYEMMRDCDTDLTVGSTPGR